MSRGQSQGDNKEQEHLEWKDIKGHHLNLLERRHKVAWGALCHVDVAGEQGVGEAREQPAAQLYVHIGWQAGASSFRQKKNGIQLFDIRCKSE